MRAPTRDRYRNFSGRADDCQVWSSTTHAHFAVSRAAIQRNALLAYEALIAKFVGADGTCLRPSSVQGTVLMERSWGLVFGCARPLGCPYAADADATAVFATCAGAERRIALRSDGALDLAAWPRAAAVQKILARAEAGGAALGLVVTLSPASAWVVAVPRRLWVRLDAAFLRLLDI